MLDSEVYWEVEVMEHGQPLKASAVILVVMIVTRPMGFVLLYEYQHTRGIPDIKYVRRILLTKYRWRPANHEYFVGIKAKNANCMLRFQGK